MANDRKNTAPPISSISNEEAKRRILRDSRRLLREVERKNVPSPPEAETEPELETGTEKNLPL